MGPHLCLIQDGRLLDAYKERGIKLSGPKLGRRPRHVDAKQRENDTDAENRRGVIERKFAFLNGSLGLDLVNTRTAESLVVEVDSAIVLANLVLLLIIFFLYQFLSLPNDPAECIKSTIKSSLKNQN